MRPRFGLLAGVLVAASCALFGLTPAPASADVPGLQASPLEYKDTLTPGHVSSGFVDVSNPGDNTITIQTSVQGFRQTDNVGHLAFFDDPDITSAIKIDLTSFDLGPREAIRVVFNVDPAKLPAGGIYAVIFFRTIDPSQSAATSFVQESANIGTLLELTNGKVGPHQGAVTKTSFQFWQFGRGLTGSLDYQNTDHSPAPAGFHPSLKVQVLPWGAAPVLTTGLVLPGVTRHFNVARLGSYFGLLPIIITDTDTHKVVTTWIFACTGNYQWVVVVLGIVIILLLPARILPVFKRRPKPKPKRSIDGLGPHPK
jgi:hypothetical protein